MVRIRQLTPGDVSWVLRSPGLFDEPSERGAALTYLRDPANLFLLATEAGQGVGFLRGTSLRQLHTRKGQFFLYEIAVLPGHRRRGVARGLIEGMLRYCRRHRLEEAFVFTSPHDRPAVGLYRSTGAVTETEADRMYVYRMDGPAAPGTRGNERSRARARSRRR
jgi:[ribosomal protein S18]-alanine N-acetyltransferase